MVFRVYTILRRQTKQKVSSCISDKLKQTSFGKGFTAQFHQTSFHPNIVVCLVPHGFLGESQNISHFSLSVPLFLSFIWLYLFIYFWVFCRLKMLLLPVTVPQWTLCVRTMTIFLHSIRHSLKKDIFWDITNVPTWLF